MVTHVATRSATAAATPAVGAWPNEHVGLSARGWRADRRWLCGTALVLVAVCGLPYLLSAQFGPANLQRLGTFWFIRDFSQYQAAMRDGAHQAGWLIHDHLSAEPHQAALMYPLYVAAGKVAALLGVGDLVVFSALEWIGRAAVLGALYALAATFLADSRQRRLAVLLALFTLGLDAWLASLRMLLQSAGFESVAPLLPDAINPYLEVSSFGGLFSAPHLMLGLALTLACPPLYLRAIAPGRRPAWLLALIGCVAGLSLVHAFNTPVLVSVLVAHALITGRRAWPAAIAAGLAAAPVALYSVALYHLDPFWSGTYGAQNLMPAPPPWALPFDFGIVLLAAPLAWRVVRGWPAERRWLILLWIGLGLAWMYAPVPYQRRLAFGVQPALAALAAVGLVELNASLRRRRIGGLGRRLVNYAVALGACSTSLLVYVSLLVSAVIDRPTEVYPWSTPEAAAAAWLGASTSAADVILASTEFANPLAGTIDGRVVHGHIVATLHSDDKRALVEAFFSRDASSDQRTSLLRQSGATIVAFGPRERALGATDLTGVASLERVYERDGVQLFRVR